MNESKRKKLNDKYADADSRAGGGDYDRLELKIGVNVIKLVDADFEENWALFLKDTEGNNKKINMSTDKGANREKFPSAFDAAEDDQSHRYYFKAVGSDIVVKDDKKIAVLKDKIQLFEVGPMIYKQISAIQKDDDYPDVDDINLKITRTGKGRNTEYTVMPGRKKTTLPDNLTGDFELADLVVETTLETVCEILGEQFEGESEKKVEKKVEKKTDDLEDDLVDDMDDDKPEKKVEKKSDEDDDLDDLDLDDLDDD